MFTFIHSNKNNIITPTVSSCLHSYSPTKTTLPHPQSAYVYIHSSLTKTTWLHLQSAYVYIHTVQQKQHYHTTGTFIHSNKNIIKPTVSLCLHAYSPTKTTLSHPQSAYVYIHKVQQKQQYHTHSQLMFTFIQSNKNYIVTPTVSLCLHSYIPTKTTLSHHRYTHTVQQKQHYHTHSQLMFTFIHSKKNNIITPTVSLGLHFYIKKSHLQSAYVYIDTS